MLLESIKLVNFRQFMNESIDFSSGENGKNVTIIIGENGTGKTTFAQAFFWCMYGETSFSDKSMLNKVVASDLRPGLEAKVLVELKLKHGTVLYTLTREQTYKKEYSGKITAQNTVFDIAKKGASGETQYVKKTMCEAEVKTILPKELSHYFFFDGERIDRMSKDISEERKSSDFAEAVKGLLGLNAIISAIDHFNPRSKFSVIGSYENSYDSKSNVKIQEYTQKIERLNEEIDKIDARLSELVEQKNAAQSRMNEKQKELKQYEDSRHIQERREELVKDINIAKTTKSQMIKNICKDFNGQINSFFSVNMIKRALEFLTEQDFTGKDIPYMHAKTIDYLLNQGKCICGTSLQEGTIAYQNVHDLIDYLPPQSISSSISDFKKEAISRAKNTKDLKSMMGEDLAVISSQDDDIEEKNDEISAIDSTLSGEDVSEKVRAINREMTQCSRMISDFDNETNSKKVDREIALRDRDRIDTERRHLAILDERNRKIEIYKAYAERIYRELTETYRTSEEQVRNKLEENINDIFKKIYDGGLSLSIDSKYHISVSVNDYDGYVETSTAQSISVIFAFIMSIIKMARENDDNSQLMTSEPYPLVMDAPLSTFDKRRIQTVCETLPEIAEQVIIFIKDTDGELAEKFMGDKIGSRHHFEKKNEFETTIV